nr:glycerol-3-phosphate acyltransferase 1, mitochondrial [Parasteatoda tepidariorum]
MAKIKCEHYNRVKIFLDSIKSSISSIGLYFSSFILHSVLNRTFNGILVHKGQLEILKAVSQEAVPMIYLPLHQSYMNSILISFIIFMNSMSVPLVPVDQDTCIPFVRYLLKFIGVFFVRNHLKNCSDVDQVLYSSVLQNYIRECLKVGYNFELFVDEDNSVPDHVHLDKYQLFPTIIESVLNGSIEDANICVVSISYEKFPSGNIVQEKLGQSEIKNSLLTTIYSLWKMIHMRFGNVRINFGQPFSIKEFIQTWKQSLPSKIPTTDTPPSSPINNSSAVAKQEFVELLQHVQKNLKKHLVYDAVFSTPLMSTHLLAFLLLTQYRKGATQQQLQNSMDWLRGLLANKKRDTGFTGQSLPVIKRAVEFLGKDLISSEVVDMEWTSSDLENNNVKITIYKPVINLPHVLELQHYASHVVPVFIIDSIVVNAIYALVDVEICHFRHCDSQLYVSRDKLIDKAIELSDLLEYEFVTIPPCSDLALSFSDSLDALVEKECLHSVGMNIIAGRPPRYSGKAHILSFDASDDEDDEDSDLPLSKEKQLKVDLSEESISHLEFLRNVLSPYIESYWLSAITLLKLIDDVKKESVFIQEMQLTAQEKLYKGLLGYEESFSAITFKNSLKLFESWHVVESYEQDGIKIVYLNENYNNKEQIDFIISKVEEFRK